MQPVEQQIANLRPTVRSGIASNLHTWMIGIALLLVIISIVLWRPVPLMVAVFFGFVGLSERQAGPNVAAAIKAFDTKVPTHGMVSITITSWDIDDIYTCPCG